MVFLDMPKIIQLIKEYKINKVKKEKGTVG